MTSQGAGPPLDAFSRIEAERACLLYGNVRIEAFETDNEELTKIRNDDKAAFRYIDFGKGAENFSVRVRPGKQGGRVDLTLDQPWQRSIGSVTVPPGGEAPEWITLDGSLTPVSGVHALWIRFYGEGEDLLELDWISFK
jgi:hypothetical protein